MLVLERRGVLGGAAVSEELYPGFTFSVCSYVVSLLRPHIIRELELARHGLEILPLETSFTPHLDGPGLCRWPDGYRTRREIRHFSLRDADRYPEFGLAMTQLSRLVKPVIDAPAPDPASLDPREWIQLGRFAARLKDASSAQRMLNLQLMTMSAADFLDRWFESDALKAPMACSGIIGTFLGVRSPGTAYVLLHHYMGEIDGAFRAWGFCKGGTGRVSLALAAAAAEHGADILTNAGVSAIRSRRGRVTGVALENGDEIAAGAVFSAVDPQRTFGLVERGELPDEYLKRLSRFKYRGSSGKVNLALDRLPHFRHRPEDARHLAGDIAIAPSLEYLERAYDQAKYGEFSRRPYLNVVIPSLNDPSVAPPGKHVMSIFVQYAPYHIKEGPAYWPRLREAFGDSVIDTLEEYAPGLRESILFRQVLTPWDLEQEFGLTEGNIFHGELGLDQLAFLRPVPGWARYRTPLLGLWLCASGTHPGGGVMAAPGELAAKSFLGGPT